MKLTKSKRAVISGLGVLVLLLLTLWVISRNKSASGEAASGIQNNGEYASARQSALPSVPAQRASFPNVPANASGGAGRHHINAGESQVEEIVALNSLKEWVRVREGKGVEIIDAKPVLDAQGKPISINVIVTSEGSLNSDALRERLGAITAHEQSVRSQLQLANQEGNIARVNELSAEIIEGRKRFVTSNEVTTYKISLSRENPPVLAFWPGLPFETVREDAARELAAGRLGEDIALKGLVNYSSATAVLCFTNGAGNSVYIDPIRVKEVPAQVLASPPPPRHVNGNNDGRESRIAAQWTEFLNPKAATTNR